MNAINSKTQNQLGVAKLRINEIIRDSCVKIKSAISQPCRHSRRNYFAYFRSGPRIVCSTWTHDRGVFERISRKLVHAFHCENPAETQATRKMLCVCGMLRVSSGRFSCRCTCATEINRFVAKGKVEDS